MKSKKPDFFVVEKKTSPLKALVIAGSALAAAGAAIAVAYKYVEKKLDSKILGRVDLNGDGETDAIMLDTTGNGEIDTIILNTPEQNEEETEETIEE